MALKEFDTFEEFWVAISKFITTKNCPTYHPCCRVWVSRYQKACQGSHTQTLNWSEVLRSVKSLKLDSKGLLHAHMLQHKWGEPIRFNQLCEPTPKRSDPPQPRLADDTYANPSQLDRVSGSEVVRQPPVSHRSEPLSPLEQEIPQRWQSQEPQFRQPERLQTIQIELKPSPNQTLPAELSTSMADIRLGMLQHTDHMREYNQHLNLSSLELKTRFSDSERAIQELHAQQIATKAELAAVVHRSTLLESQLLQVQKLLSDLTRRLNPATAESVAVQAVKNEMTTLEQKLARAENARVCVFADPGCGRTRSPRVPPAVPAAAERLRPSGRPPGLEQAGCTAAEESGTVPTPTQPGQQTGQATKADQRTLGTTVLRSATILIACASTFRNLTDFTAVVIVN